MEKVAGMRQREQEVTRLYSSFPDISYGRLPDHK
jgi:hypothetical protein